MYDIQQSLQIIKETFKTCLNGNLVKNEKNHPKLNECNISQNTTYKHQCKEHEVDMKYNLQSSDAHYGWDKYIVMRKNYKYWGHGKIASLLKWKDYVVKALECATSFHGHVKKDMHEFVLKESGVLDSI